MATVSIPEIMNIIYVIVTIAVAVTISLKYINYREKNLLLVGIAWNGLAVIFFSDIIATTIKVFNLPYDPEMLFFVYVFFNFIILPIFAFLWLLAIIDLLSLKTPLRLTVLISYIIFSVFYEIFIIFMYLTNPSVIGTLIVDSPLGPQGYWADEAQYLLFVFIIIVLITGLLFAAQTLRSESSEIKLKGRLLMLAFICFAIGGFFDTIFSILLDIPIEVLMPIARTIMIASSILFYFGYTLPGWLKRLFLKEA